MAQIYKVEGLCVDVRDLVLGSMDNNVYFITDGEGTMVVDPSSDLDLILEVLGDSPLDAIIITHSHYDHVGAAAGLREATGAPVIASVLDAPEIENPTDDGTSEIAQPCKVDQTVCEGDVVSVGNMRWSVIETPGHSIGSISLFIEPSCGNHPDGHPVLIAGDTLFAGTVGRTDFEGGSMQDMRASIKKLSKLPDDTVVLPGHNSLTTIGNERQRVFARLGVESD